MLVLLDTNVALDLLLEREPWFSDASEFWELLDSGQITGHITATMVTDIFYIARRLVGRAEAFSIIRRSLSAFIVLSVGRQMLDEALTLVGSDYEDNVQIACARISGLDAIVTRDPVGFRGASIPVLSPAEAIRRFR